MTSAQTTTDSVTAEELAAIAHEAAAAGAAVLAERSRVSPVGLPLAAGDSGQQAKSSPADLVTDFDRRAEQAVREVLRSRRPQDAISGEEYGTTTVDDPSGYRWSIDPLDGTTNFIRGIVYYATSVGVVGPDGTWLSGVVRAPALRRVWWAVRGGGAFTAALIEDQGQQGPLAELIPGSGLRSEAVRLHGPAGPKEAGLLSTGFGYDPQRRRSQAASVAEMLECFGNLRRIGSAALDMCMVADGTVEAYAEYGIWEHDWAAAALIVEEAGVPMHRPQHPDSHIQPDWTVAGGLGIGLERLSPPPLSQQIRGEGQIHVRRAREDDLPRVSEISRRAYLEGGHLARDSHYLPIIADASSRFTGGELFVAELDGAVVGSVVLARAGGEFAELAQGGELEFRVLSVAPEAQGRGVGRALVRHLLNLAAAEEAEAMVICSMSTMQAAHRLYLAEGFEPVPSRDLVIDGVGRFPTFVHRLGSSPAG